jgi:ZIP family zinc transporter
MSENVLFAFGLTLFAGLSTGIGSALAFFSKRTNTKFLSIALGFSAGVMLYVSFVEIFIKARDALAVEFGLVGGTWYTVTAFFGGIFLIALIDKLVPSFENPHEIRNVEEMAENGPSIEHHKLLRMGYFTALAIAIHNFPEGLATFAAALSDPARWPSRSTIYRRVFPFPYRCTMPPAVKRRPLSIPFYPDLRNRWVH